MIKITVKNPFKKKRKYRKKSKSLLKLIMELFD